MCSPIPPRAKRKPTRWSQIWWLAKIAWHDVTWKSSILSRVNAVIIATTNRTAILLVLWRHTDSLYCFSFITLYGVNWKFTSQYSVRTKFPNRQHFPNGQCYAELGNTTFWNSSEFSNLCGFSFVVSLFVLWECFPLHHLSFISFKKFWPCEMKFDRVVSI